MGRNYHIGVDIAYGSDYTMYCVTKDPNKLQRLLNRLMGRENVRKVVYCGDDERQMRKYKYRGATIYEENVPKHLVKP